MTHESERLAGDKALAEQEVLTRSKRLVLEDEMRQAAHCSVGRHVPDGASGYWMIPVIGSPHQFLVCSHCKSLYKA